jgi:hypothetical protein
MRNTQHTPIFRHQFHWKYWLSAVFALVLLSGAIYSTSAVAKLSYQSAQLESQERQLQQRKQYLEEAMATASSLETAEVYALAEGFSQPTNYQAELDVIPSLAQAQ